MAITDGIAWAYTLTEASGDALDALGSNDLTAVNSPGSASGLFGGNCRTFSRPSAQYFSHADSADFSFNGSFSIAMLARASSLTSNRTLIDKHFGSQINLYQPGSAHVDWTVYGSSGYGNGAGVRASSALSDDGNFHLVIASHLDGSKIRLRVDNGTAVETSHTAGVYDGPGSFILGGDLNGFYWNGDIQMAVCWKGRILDTTEEATLYNSGAFLQYPFGGGGPVNDVLTADAGIFTITGQAVTLRAARKLIADHGSYTISGQDVFLQAARKLVAEHGSFTITGQSVGMLVKRILIADHGSYSISGQDIGLLLSRKLIAEYGSFSVSGQSVILSVARKLTAAHGVYTITGQDVDLVFSGEEAVVVAALSHMMGMQMGNRRNRR